MYKKFIPEYCPECGEKLRIINGKAEDTIKLVCVNKECSGILLKKMQKGIVALEIKGIGPKVIEKLVDAGIEHSYDLFDKTKFSSEVLCATGLFRKGRSLDILLDSVSEVKELHIKNVILSLQLKDIGKTYSEKIGRLMSDMNADLSGMQLDIKANIQNKESNLYKKIEESIKKFEDFGIKVIRYENKVVDNKVVKKIEKSVDSTVDISEIIEKLNWNLTDIKNPDCKLLIVNDLKEDNEKIRFARDNGIKIMTLKQVKLVFV